MPVFLSRLGVASVCAFVAAAVSAPLLWLGPPGIDSAAHVYQRAFLLHHGFALWNNLWYAGRYSFVDYSLLYYPLAILGIRLLALMTVVVAAFVFARLTKAEFGQAGRWPSLAFAALWGASVVTGAFPFLLGAALALATLAAIRDHRRALAGAGLLLTVSASPLAFAFLALVLLAFWIAAADRRRWRSLTWVVLSVCAVAALAFRLFPTGGSFPFSWASYLGALTFCLLGLLLTWRVERAAGLCYVFAVYLLAVTASFLLPSVLGGNVIRLRFIAVPLALLVLGLRRWRPLAPALLTLALALSWNTTPLLSSFAQAADDPTSAPSYWQPAVSYLKQHLSHDYRVEVVDTDGHWGAAYLPEAGVPIARGWFRQQDFPENKVLYQQGLNRKAYLGWLRRLGVKYVVLTDAQSDYSSRAERQLIVSGRSGLKPVLETAHLRVYVVPQATPLLTPSGHVIHLGAETITLALPQAGAYRLAIRYSPYWRARGACLRQDPDGFIRLTAPAGRVCLHFVVSGEAALSALSGEPPNCAEQLGG